MLNFEKKVHLGCGRTILEGWINVDAKQLPGVDLVADLDHCQDVPLPFDSDSIDEFLASHVIEHLVNPSGRHQSSREQPSMDGSVAPGHVDQNRNGHRFGDPA